MDQKSATTVNSGNSATQGDTINGGGPLAPTALTIATGVPLAVSASLPKTSTVTTNGAQDPANANAGVAGGAGSTHTAGALSYGNGIIAVSGSPASVNATPVTAGDATASYTTTVTVTATWPSGATPSCSIEAPFASAATCSLTTFAVSSTGLTTTGNFQMRAAAANGGATDFKLSNKLPVTGYGVRQITNFGGGSSATTNDAIYGPMPVYKGRLYFANYSNLFAIDSVANTVTQVENVINGNTGPEYLSYDAVGNLLNFNAKNQSNGVYKTYVWDAVTPYITQVGNAAGNAVDDARYRVPVYCGGKSYYWAVRTANVFKVFELNPPSTFTQISDTKGAATDGPTSLNTMYCVNNKLYMGLYEPGSTNMRLYVYNPAVGAASFAQISRTNPGFNDSMRDPLGVYDNGTKALIVISLGGNQKVVSLDTTNDTLTQISNTRAGSPDITHNDEPTRRTFSATLANGKIFFGLLNSSNRMKLFSFDPNTSKLEQVANINAAGTHDLDNTPRYYIYAYNNKIFFTGLNASNRTKLYRWDDATQTLTQITNTAGTGNHDFNIAAGSMSLSEPLFTVYNGKAFFRANIDAAGVINKFFLYDDATGLLTQVTNTAGAAAADSPWGNYTAEPTVYNSKLYFGGFNSGGYEKLHALCDPSAGCTP